MKNHFYIPSSQSQMDDVPLWDLELLDDENGKASVPVNSFMQHVDLLHSDDGIGFKKEYNYILSSSSGKKGIKIFVVANHGLLIYTFFRPSR